MTALAVAPAADPAGYAQRVAELVDVAALVARGLDLQRLRFVPAPSDPLFGYARCPVRGCVNVTEHTATSLCTRCQHRYGRWQRATGGDLERFLAEVTQMRSEDLERLCLVCRSPGHERPAAAQGLCYSCLSQAKGRGQSIAAYVVGASIAELDVSGCAPTGCGCSSPGRRTVCAWRSPIPTASGATTSGTCACSASRRPTGSTSRRSVSRGCASLPSSGAASRHRWCTPPQPAARSLDR